MAEDSPSRQLIERRYGKTNIRKLVAKYQDEQSNKKYLEDSTTACPGCNIHIEKSLGCNHVIFIDAKSFHGLITLTPQMTCGKCKQHFCYRCGDKLDPSNPYVHFSTPGHRCYSKLFDFQSVDEEWEPM